jgi:hypothetical protein
MNKTSELRAHVVELLRGGHAHVTFDDAVADLPADMRSVRTAPLPYSPWELVEHIRITQRDILDYSRARAAADYASIPWPDGYWPKTQAPPHAGDWDRSLDTVRSDLVAMTRLVEDASRDLLAPLPASTEGHTLLREALLAADHTAYHVGELVAVRRLLGAWR